MLLAAASTSRSSVETLLLGAAQAKARTEELDTL
jgi:hypothetical protein